MKQTNNAIKFLMAQYRAIFKHAYLKGIASAVVMTAGLAAGASNAVAAAAISDLTGFATPGDATLNSTISGSGDKLEWNANVTVSGTAAGLTASGAALSFTGSGNLTVGMDSGTSTFTLTPDSGSISIDIASVNVKAGTLAVGLAASASGARFGAKTFNVGTDESEVAAILSLGTSGTIGSADAPTALDSTLTIGSNGSLFLTASGSAAATVNFGDVKLYGILDTQDTDSDASGELTINLLQGEMSGDKASLTVRPEDTVNLKFQTDSNGKASNTFDVKSGKVTLSGTLSVSGGTLKLGSKTLDAASAGTLTVDTSGTLAISSEDLKAANKAIFDLSGTNSTLQFTDDTQVELSSFTFIDTDSAAATKIGLSSTAIVEGKDLSVSKALTVGTSNKPILKAETLTLGSADANNADSLKFKEATAANVKFLDSDTFVLVDKLTLQSISDEKTGSTYTAQQGSISGDVILSGSDPFTIDGGKYNYNDTLTFSSGSLSVTNTSGADTSLLTLKGDVVFDNSKGNNTVTVSGSGAVLDLSQAQNITVTPETNTDGYKTTIAASASGTLVVVQDNIDNLFAASNKSGSTISLDGGTLQVSGDLSLSEDMLASAGTAGDRTINFSTSSGGTLNVDGTLTITAADPSEGALDIGSKGNITVDTLSLQNVKDNKVTLQSGNFTVANGLSTASTQDTVVLTSGNLTLGQVDTDENNVSTASKGGNVSNNLRISGDGLLRFNAGDWVIQDLELATGTGTATIGGESTVVDANGDAIKTTVSGQKLTVANGAGSVTVNSTGTATFAEAYLSNTNSLQVSGTATINGKYTPADADTETPASYGVSLASGAISVGGTGTLTLGTGVTKAIDVSGDDVTINKDANIETGAIEVTGGKLVLSFESGSNNSFNAAALNALKEALVSEGNLNDGSIKLVNAEITGLTDQISNNELTWDKAEEYKDILEDYTTDKLSQAVVTGIESSDQVRGNFGALSSDTLNSGSSINLDGNTSLSAAANNDGAFASGVNGAVLGLNVSNNKVLTLENGGKAGTIKLGSGSEVKVINGATTLAAIDGGSGSKVTLANAATTVNGKAKAATFTTNAGSDLVVTGDLETLADSDASTFEGSVKVSGNATFKSKAELSGNDNVFTKSLNANEFLGVYGDTQVSGTATFDKGAEVADGATLTATTVVLKSNTVLSVGSDGDEETSGSAGYLDVGTLALNGGTLVIDPDYTQASSVAAIDKLSGSSTHDTSKGGVLSGSIAVAQNSGLMLGDGASRASMLEFMQQLPGFDGALDQNEIGSVAYLTSQITIADGGKLIIDSTNTQDGILSDSQIDPAYLSQISDVDLYLGKNSALAVDDAVLDEVGGAIYFDTDTAKIKGESGSKIILVGDGFLDEDTITLFTDKGTTGETGVYVEGDAIRVETLNGLMYFYLDSGENEAAKTLNFDTVKAKSAFLGASTPVRNTLLSYASKTVNYQDYGTANAVTVVGNKADQSLFTINAEAGTFDLATGVDANLYSASDYVLQDGVVYERAYNSFLQKVTRNSNSGIEADQAARLAAFGGAMQAALSAGATTYDAISGRMGIGAQTGSITFADNGQGAGLWVTPVYKNHDSDGFEAQGLGYGVDMDLYGLALGADYSLGNGLRVGAAFNVGSGDADGQGAGSVVSNDFDYYGFAVYGGYTLGALSLVGDVSYTVVDNDLEANTAADKLTTSTDTSILSVGVTGQYTFNLTSVDVTPHAGLRYSYLDMDDYAVKGSDGVVGNYTADSMSVFSIPVGVTFAKDIVSGDWTIKPALDLTLTANMGDDTTDGTMSWSGVSNLNTAVQTEVLDNFTYGATLGVSAKSGNMSFGFGVNYTGSSSADEYGVGANARFVF